MQLAKKFNALSFQEYIQCIDNHKKYKDFNTLGLYRSIVENEKLTLEEKLAVREHAHKFFRKSFDFLPLKDPMTFMKVAYLGEELTKGDEEKIRADISKEQQRILKDKRIKHRNFGIYSKHSCGYDDCIYNGLMIKQGSWLTEDSLHFESDKNKYQQKVKSDRRKSERKNHKQLILKEESFHLD